MSLYIYSFQPDLPRLMRLAARERLLPSGDDPGYAIHAVFAACFGDHAPATWALLAPGQGGGPRGRLLAYGGEPLATLREHAAIYADPVFAAPLMLDDAADRSMPQNFSVGTRFGFQVRIRPISRMGRPIPGHPSALERGNRTRERDVYLARVEAAERISVGAGEDASASVPSRATCYLEWLDARLNDMGASIERMSGAEDTPTFAARLDAFRFTRLRTRDRSKEATQSRAVDGPDATVTGTLVITDPEAFATGLVRGIGRFRAFGFGMLLLSPPRKG